MDPFLMAGQRQIREGFPGQRSAVLPRSVVSSWLANDPLFDIVPSDVGYYPSAQSHYVDRPKGSAQLILIYCFAGEGWARVGGHDVRVEAGQVLVVPPNTPHVYAADQHNPWTIYWIHLAGRKTKTILRLLELTPPAYLLYPGHDPALPPLFERIWHLLNSDYSDESLQAASTSTHQLTAHLIGMRHRLQDGEDSHSARIKHVIEVMNRALDQKLTLEELARHANMSKSHFAFVFKKRTGFAPLDYFMRLKMQRACFLLDTTSLPVKAIASVLGFEDSLYFSRRFRHIHSCSPVQYRAIQKG
ncbi:AraC family transcriptional regulator [uncultured Cohaesibacter sp.]|uniref:AraC family transcriptional regulator n=1 Tax=uncultured Cohaesibacter sp. TaxID=1002546 RepID=UPI0029C63FB1|nr:AraC family transcriptional regulator [uncultured Cohaesibacter sp.]